MTRSASRENSSGRILIATSRFSFESRARYTSPIPPTPRRAMISCEPRTVPIGIGIIGADYIGLSLATDGREIQNQLSMKNPTERDEKPDALCGLDRDCRYVYINQAMAELHGINPESHTGKRVSEIVPRMTEIVTFAVREVLRTQAPLVISVIGQLLPTNTDTTRHWVACYLPVTNGTEVAVVATEIKHGSESANKTL